MHLVRISCLEKWIIFMIRLLLIMPFLYSCASLDYAELYNIAKVGILGVDDIPIDQDLINKTKYSFVKVKIGKSSVAIMPLSSIENNVYKWVGSDATIYTKNGKIIKTFGLEHDIDLIENNNNQSIIMLKNPDALITQRINITQLNSSNENFIKINETFYTEDFTWKGNNEYLIEKSSGLSYKSTQEIHPRLKIMSLEFVYVF